MKVLALYLPQFHRIPENDKWWGEGYTEWSAVKEAKPIYKGHIQPKIPLDKNYYDLSDQSGSVWKWQTNLAKRYGIYGFCIYHYWFEGKMLLEKPMEILLAHPEIDIKYCICWANHSWTRTWYGLESEVLMNQTYGQRPVWEKHFEYLLKFFKDSRYIKIDDKPVIHLFHTAEIEKLLEMRKCWENLAIDAGFKGIYIVSCNSGGDLDEREELFDAYYNMEPSYTLKHKMNKVSHIAYLGRTFFVSKINQFFKREYLERKVNILTIYKDSVKPDKMKKKVYLGTVPVWDNTPRRSYKGLVYTNSSKNNFLRHLQKLNSLTSDSEFIYVNAWNEWGEGAYLEPDVENGYSFLEAIYEVVMKDKEND